MVYLSLNLPILQLEQTSMQARSHQTKFGSSSRHSQQCLFHASPHPQLEPDYPQKCQSSRDGRPPAQQASKQSPSVLAQVRRSIPAPPRAPRPSSETATGRKAPLSFLHGQGSLRQVGRSPSRRRTRRCWFENQEARQEGECCQVCE